MYRDDFWVASEKPIVCLMFLIVEVKCPADSVMNTSEHIPITARTQKRQDAKEGCKQSVIISIMDLYGRCNNLAWYPF